MSLEIPSKKNNEETFKWKIWNFQSKCAGDTYTVFPAFFCRGRFEWRLSFIPEQYKNKKWFTTFNLTCESPIENMIVEYKFSILDFEKKEIQSMDCSWKRLNVHTKDNSVSVRFIYKHGKESSSFGSSFVTPLNQLNEFIVLCKWTVIQEFSLPNLSNGLLLYSEMHKGWNTFREMGKFCDVTLVAGDREFRAHKIILANHSSVFSAMFEHDMKEQNLNRVQIADIDGDVLEELLNCIYTYKSNILDTHVESLLIAADKYDIKALKDLCEKTLWKMVEIKNAVHILLLADSCNASHLKKNVINFIVNNAKEIVANNIDLPLNNPSHVELLSEIFRQLAQQDKNE